MKIIKLVRKFLIYRLKFYLMSNLSFMLTLLVLLIADVFNSFKDERGSFKACLCEDTKGMLSL